MFKFSMPVPEICTVSPVTTIVHGKAFKIYVTHWQGIGLYMCCPVDSHLLVKDSDTKISLGFFLIRNYFAVEWKIIKVLWNVIQTLQNKAQAKPWQKRWCSNARLCCIHSKTNTKIFSGILPPRWLTTQPQTGFQMLFGHYPSLLHQFHSKLGRVNSLKGTHLQVQSTFCGQLS